MSNLSRRSVMLTGAAASLAAGSLAAEADQAPTFSPEYQECYRRWIDYERFRLSRALAEETTDEDPDFDAVREADREDTAPYRAAKDRLFERPVRNVFDIVALLRVAWWEDGHFVRVDDWRETTDEAKTLRAVEPLVGGSWGVPEDIVRLDAAKQVKDEADSARRLASLGRHLRVNIDPDYVWKPGEMDAWLEREYAEMNAIID
jgi:hypothetical protein